ncbi:cytochrome P450 [Hymenopellis radicata]|nr:cytochrome P450 [Hymenopellis radicata]
MASELMQWKWDFGFTRYSDIWRLHRKTFHQYFNSNEVGAYHPIQWKASVATLKQILRQPDDFRHLIRHHIGSTVLFIAYGYEVQPKDDRFVQIIDKALQEAGWAMFQGNYLVDYFPILRLIPAWFPFASFKKDAAIAAKDSLEVLNAPFDWTLRAMAEGRAETSFVSRCFERLHLKATDEVDREKEIVEVIKNCAAITFAVLRKAQMELDAVVGRTRLPNFEDRSNLPFINAIILEALRWRPVLPLAVAHANVNDDVYNGYCIPGGSTVLGNVWAMMHDEDVYPNAEAFDPERFLGPTPQPDPTKVGVFGFGRRICAGRYFALQGAYIQVACLLWAFNIGPAQDANGNDVLPDPNAYVDRCKFTPRFPNVESVIEQAGSIAS